MLMMKLMMLSLMTTLPVMKILQDRVFDIFEGNNQVAKKILDSKKPLIILGESFFKSQSSEFLFKCLYKAGFSNQPSSTQKEDGLKLFNTYITSYK